MNSDTLTPLPVAGYTAQTSEAVEIVNIHKTLEEHLLRRCLLVEKWLDAEHDKHPDPIWSDKDYGYGWLAEAERHFQMGFMCLNRAVFRPQRIKLPEDPV